MGEWPYKKVAAKRPLEMLLCVCSKAILHKIASSLIGEAVLKYDMMTQSKKKPEAGKVLVCEGRDCLRK